MVLLVIGVQYDECSAIIRFDCRTTVIGHASQQVHYAQCIIHHRTEETMVVTQWNVAAWTKIYSPDIFYALIMYVLYLFYSYEIFSMTVLRLFSILCVDRKL